MDKEVLLIDKPIGQTPLESIDAFKAEHPGYEHLKMAYAGRLDPMAEGLLIVLVGDECKKRDEYQGLNKTYEFDVLLGVSTDSGDTLGMVKNLYDGDITDKLKLKDLPKELGGIIDKVKSIKEQKYPAFSSYHVDGKPLWWWAKNNKIHEIEIPSKQVTINSLKVMRVYEVEAKDLLEEIEYRVELVSGDFRQKEIIEKWRNHINDNSQVFPVLSFEISVTSGTYIRSIAEQIGEWLSLPSIAYRIRRTRVGNFILT